jgi:hypothetical protein
MGDLYSEVRKLINHQILIFNGGDAHAHLMKECDDAFTVLEENAEELEDEGITDDLDKFIKYGICTISHNFENGKPIGPNVMNVLIRAVRLYNSASSRPFQFDSVCELRTHDGMSFLSNTVLEIVHSPGLQFLPHDYPPWQLHVEPPRPRPRPASTLEEPLTLPRQVIIFHTHGIMPVMTCTEENTKLPKFKHPFEGLAFGPGQERMLVSSSDYRKNRVVEFQTPVDVFTTTQFGMPLHWFMADDPPQLVFAKNLLEMVPASEPHTKSAFRQLVKGALCKMRDDYIPDKKSTCKVRCHHAGYDMADLLLFCGKGAATVEGIVSIDVQTRRIEHMTHQFGLVSKETHRVLREYPKSDQPPSKYRVEEYGRAKERAQMELEAFQGAHAVPVNYRMYALQKHAKNLELGIRGMHRESEFEWSPEMKLIHGDEIRLSVLLRIGITAGLIDPDAIVVVLSCRTPEKHLPIGTKTPRRDEESESEGGGRNLKKHKRFNQSKKRKQRTTSRKSRKSKKH